MTKFIINSYSLNKHLLNTFQVLFCVSEKKKKKNYCVQTCSLPLGNFPSVSGRTIQLLKTPHNVYIHPFSTYTPELTPSPSKRLLGNWFPPLLGVSRGCWNSLCTSSVGLLLSYLADPRAHTGLTVSMPWELKRSGEAYTYRPSQCW